MARITWQNVAAPDFRGVGQNYEVMSRLLGNAAQAGEGMLDVFRNAHQQAADRNILQRQAGVPNAAAFDGNAIIGQDGGHASLDTLRGVQNQRGDLLRQDILNQALQEAQYGHGRTMDRDSRLDGARESIARNFQFGARGNHGRVNNLYELPGLSNLDPDDLYDIMTQAQGLQSTHLTNERNIRDDGWARDDRDDETAALEAAAYVNSRSSDQRSRARLIESQRRRLNPRAFALLEEVVQGQSGWRDTRAPVDFGNVSGGSSAPTSSGGRASGAIASVAGGGTTDRGGGVSTGSRWAESVGLLNNESGGNYRAQNNETGSSGRRGHYGGLQFGHDRLDDAKRAGVIPNNMTAEEFRDAGKDVQDRVADWHFADIDRQAGRLGLERYHGQEIGGVQINQDSIRAMAHLGGVQGVRRFIESNGRHNPADANGTRLSDYGQRFGSRRDPGQSGEQFTPEVQRSFANYVGNQINGTRISESNLARMVEHFGVGETRRYLQSSGRQDPERNGVRMSEIAEVSAYADRTPEQTQASYVEDQLLRAVQAGRPSNNPLSSDTPQLFSNLDEEGREITLSRAANTLKQDPVFAGMSMEDIQFHLKDLMDKADVKAGVAMRMMQESGTVPSTARSLGLPDTINPFDGFFGLYRRQGAKANVPELTRQIRQYRVDPETGRSPVEDHISNSLATQRQIEQRQQVAQRIQELQGMVSAASSDPRQDNNVQQWRQEINALTHTLNQMTEGSGGATDPTYEQQVVQEMYELLPPELVEEALAPDTLPARKEEIHSLYLQRKMAQERGAARTRELAEARQQRARQESIERMRRMLEMEGRI